MFALVGKDGVFWGRQVSGGGAKVRMPRAAWVDDDADDNDDDMTSIDAAAALRRSSRRTTHHLASPTHSLTRSHSPSQTSGSRSHLVSSMHSSALLLSIHSNNLARHSTGVGVDAAV